MGREGDAQEVEGVHSESDESVAIAGGADPAGGSEGARGEEPGDEREQKLLLPEATSACDQ